MYSLWSRGRVLGHTDLGFKYRERGFRVGWFHPNELGDKLMPQATGVAPAMRACHDAGRNLLTDPGLASAFDPESGRRNRLRRAARPERRIDIRTGRSGRRVATR